MARAIIAEAGRPPTLPLLTCRVTNRHQRQVPRGGLYIDGGIA
jgi:hypothetical protein